MKSFSGFDWIIQHEGNLVRHTAYTGEHALIYKTDYEKMVMQFADEVKQFYDNSKPKTLPEDEFDLKGYRAFWKEWESLRNKYN